MGAELLVDFLLGRCPAEALQANLGARLVALHKKGGGLRPVAMGSVLRRLAARAACRVLKESVSAAVGPHQFGVGRRAGCELVHKLVTAHTDADPTRVVLAFDASNAFGSMPRQKIWDAVQSRLPDLAPTLQAWFRSQTMHVWWDRAGVAHKVKATAGVDQGCPLSPLLFALGLAPALDEIAQGLASLDASCRVFAYLDDVVVVVPAGRARAALSLVSQAFNNVGLALHESKTKAWVKDTGTPLDPVVAALRVPSIQLLGSQVAWLEREEQQAPVHGRPNGAKVLSDARALAERIVELRKAGLALRPAFLVLQTFANSCVNHLQRANYEEGPWVEELENLLQDALASLLTFPGDHVAALGQVQRTIARMRLKDGGCGFGGLPTRSATAFLGSWCQCLHEVASDLGCHSVAGFQATCPSVAASMERAARQAKNLGCFYWRGHGLAWSSAAVYAQNAEPADQAGGCCPKAGSHCFFGG